MEINFEETKKIIESMHKQLNRIKEMEEKNIIRNLKYHYKYKVLSNIGKQLEKCKICHRKYYNIKNRELCNSCYNYEYHICDCRSCEIRHQL